MHASQLQPTLVLDTYWRFAARRQDVYFARLLGSPPPWTEDRVISAFRFTNSYRAADRVSQFLIRHVIYQEDMSLTPEDTFFRIVLYKLFNKIETWQMLEEELGPIRFGAFRVDAYDRVLTRALEAGRPIYSAAYIMPSAGNFGYSRKHRNHLALLETMMRDSLCAKISRAPSMKRAFELLREYPSIGDFLAYQLVTDINYSELTDFAEDDFVVAGPGAIDGIGKVFRDTGGMTDADVIRLMCDVQEDEFARLGVVFRDLFGRRLQYIDCQNLFCEVGKYCRVAHPQYVGRSGRTRIKQKFTKAGPLPCPWFPPKWNINARVPARLGIGSEFAWT